MADYVASQTISLDDQVSAGAQAATDALGKLADAGDAAAASTDNVSASVTKAGASAATLASRFDPATKAANDLAKAQAQLEIGSATMASAVEAGTKTQAQADAVTASLTGRVTAARAAVDQLSDSQSNAAKTAAGLTDANAEAAHSADAAGAAHAGFYREIVILGHEVVSGNFARIPGSLLVLAERSGNLDTIFQKVIATVTSLPGILTIAGAAGVAAFGALAISADNAIQKQLDLQTHLQATRDDYVSAAGIAGQAAHLASNATPGLSVADARAATGALSSNPEFTGTAQQLATLTELAADMAKVFDETVVKAADDLAAAMQNPGEAADKLVGHLRGMTQATADSIVTMTEAGDKAGAFAEYVDVVGHAVDGAAEKLSPLRSALNDLRNVFDSSGESVTGFAHVLVEGMTGAIFSATEAVAHLLKGLNEATDLAARALGLSGSHPAGSAAAGAAAPTNASKFGDPGIYDDLATVGGTLGLTDQQIAFARSVTRVESGGNQYNNSDNSLVTSSAGALGAMQLEPATARAYGQDPTTIAGNLSAGEQFIKHLWEKYNGDQTLIAMAYTWGEPRLDAWIAAGSDPNSAEPGYKNATNYAAKVAPGGVVAAFGSSAAGVGVANNDQSVIDQGLKAAENSPLANADKAAANVKLLQQSLQDLIARGTDPSSESVVRLNGAIEAAQLALSNASAPRAKATDALNDQINAQDALTDAYGKGHEAVMQATAANAGLAQAIQVVGTKSDQYYLAIDLLTQKHLALAQATNATAVAQQTLSNSDQLQYLQAETSSLGENTDARNAMLADLKAEQLLREKGISDLSTEGQAYIASVDAISAQSAALAKNQQTMSDLENAATTAFDTVGSAITNAFAMGSKSALNFGAIANTILSQIADQVLKLAVLNPVLNSLFGGNKTTLSDASGLLGQLLGGGGTGNTAAPAGPDLGGGYTQIGGQDIQSGLNTYLAPISAVSGGGGGFGGAGGLFSSLGLTGSGGLFSTPLSSLGLGSGTVGGALGGIGLGFGAGTLLNGVLGGNSQNGEIGSGVGAAAGAAIGSIIPGVGTIIGGLVGGLAGGLFGGLIGPPPTDATEYTKLNLTTGSNQELGNGPGGPKYSAANAAAANALANLVYAGQSDLTSAFNLQPLNTSIEAKVGNRDGSFVRFDNGTQLNTSGSSVAGQATVGNQAVDYLVGKIGSSLDATTLAILKEIDYSKSTATQQVAALAAAVGTAGQLDAYQLKALPNINVANVDSATSDLSFVKNTYEPAINGAADQGSISTATAAVTTQFTALISQASRLGLAIDGLTAAQTTALQAITDAANQTIAASSASVTSAYQKENGDTLGSQLTTFDQAGTVSEQQLTDEFKGLFGDSYTTNADYVKQMGLLTATITEQRTDLMRTYQEQQLQQGLQTDQTWIGNVTAGWKAQASIAETSNYLPTVQFGQQLDEDADLTNFDASAKVQTEAYSQSLLSTYGQGFASSQAYANAMVDLENSLAEQRLAIQSQYAQQSKAMEESAAQAASGVVTGLTGFAQSLQQGSASPLSAQAQYALAKTQYDSIAQQAEGGNVTALGEVQQYAQAFLLASQNVNGSGVGYVSDFQNVLSALQTIATIPQMTLTQDFMAQQFEDQTTVLSNNLQAIQSALASLKLEISQQSARPAV